MGNTFGVYSLLCGVAAIALVWVVPLYLIIIPGAAIVFGGIGIAKDDTKTLGIVGVVVGSIGFILWILMPIFLVTLVLSML
ncbi:MAG: hypothetical protein ACXADU_00380 [Promethearchaeota archaeon]